MLKFLRKRENVKKIMWALAILIIPAFILWGSGSTVRSKDRPNYAGKIFGKKISFQQYQETFSACKTAGLLIYGEDFNKVAHLLNLEDSAWERLILLYQVKKEKIKVADNEVINFIQNLPLFQEDGRFRQERYKMLLDYFFRMGMREFEEQVREMLQIDKLKNKIIAKVDLTDEEIEKVYKNEYESAKASYILIEPREFESQVHPSYEQLAQYYESNQAQFKKPEQVNVQYIALYFDHDRPEVSVSEEELQDYYQKHLDEFSSSDKKENAKPFAEVKENIKEKLTQLKAKEILEDKIWQIVDEIGDDAALFEDIAKKNQLEVKETGFFGPQDAVADVGLSYEFLNTAFNLKPDQVSNVIETPKGYFVIKLKQKKQPYIPTLDEIKDQVETAVIMQQSWGLAENKAKDLAAQIKKLMQEQNLSFAKAAEKLTLPIKETEPFSRNSYIPGIGQSPEFAQAAFGLNIGAASDLIPVPNGYCILSPNEIIPIDQEKFAQEKEEFAKQLLERKKDIFYKIWLAGLKKKADLVDNIEKFKKQNSP